MSEITPSVTIRSTKYWEPSLTEEAYLDGNGKEQEVSQLLYTRVATEHGIVGEFSTSRKHVSTRSLHCADLRRSASEAEHESNRNLPACRPRSPVIKSPTAEGEKKGIRLAQREGLSLLRPSYVFCKLPVQALGIHSPGRLPRRPSTATCRCPPACSRAGGQRLPPGADTVDREPSPASPPGSQKA